MTPQAPPQGVEFGALPRKSCYGDGTFPQYEHRFKLLPRSTWKPVSLNRHVLWIRSQLDGMCTANGAASAMEAERSIRNRDQNPELSAEHLYLQHSRWGTGSTLGENLRTLINPGVVTMDDCGGDQIRSTREFPSGDSNGALSEKNRMLEWVDGNASFDALATGLQLGMPGVAGVYWQGGGGHAFAVTELCVDPGHGHRWAIRGPNSWGEGWGEPPGYTAEEIAWLEMQDREILDGGWYTLTERQCADFKTFGIWLAGSSV